MIKRTLAAVAVLSLIVVGTAQVDAAVHHGKKSSKSVPALMATPSKAAKHTKTLSATSAKKHSAKHAKKHASKHAKLSAGKAHKKAK